MSQGSNQHPHDDPRHDPSRGLRHDSHGGQEDQTPLSGRRLLAGCVVAVAVLGVLATIGILHRTHGDTVLADRTQQDAPPTVGIAPAEAGAPTDNFVLPGNVTAFTDAPIFARTDGYLLHWYHDIGARVKKGDLLA